MRFALVEITWHAASQMSWIENPQPKPKKETFPVLWVWVCICVWTDSCVGVLNDAEGVGSKSLPFRRRRVALA